jgi:hypothetical protein
MAVAFEPQRRLAVLSGKGTDLTDEWSKDS